MIGYSLLFAAPDSVLDDIGVALVESGSTKWVRVAKCHWDESALEETFDQNQICHRPFFLIGSLGHVVTQSFDHLLVTGTWRPDGFHSTLDTFQGPGHWTKIRVTLSNQVAQ